MGKCVGTVKPQVWVFFVLDLISTIPVQLFLNEISKVSSGISGSYTVQLLSFLQIQRINHNFTAFQEGTKSMQNY
jgi:hypothetical protein